MNEVEKKFFQKYWEYVEGVKDDEGDIWYAILSLQETLNSFIFQVNKANPEPIQIKVAMYDELGEMIHELKPSWAWWTNKDKKVDKEKLLEEAVDFLHFYMSYLIETDEVSSVYNEGFGFEFDGEETDYEIPEIIDLIVEAVNEDSYDDIEYWFSKLLQKFGITPEDIWRMYVKKSFENYLRQVSGKYAKTTMEHLEAFAKMNWFVMDSYVD